MGDTMAQAVGAIDETIKSSGSAQNHLRLMVMKVQELNRRGIKPIYTNPYFCEWDEVVKNDYTIIKPDGSTVHMHYNGVVEKIHHTINVHISVMNCYDVQFINNTGKPIPNNVAHE